MAVKPLKEVVVMADVPPESAPHAVLVAKVIVAETAALVLETCNVDEPGKQQTAVVAGLTGKAIWKFQFPLRFQV
jgi:hypothetical protein